MSDDPTLFDNATITGSHHPDTSYRAARRVLPRTGSMKRQIMEWLYAGGPNGDGTVTCDEVERKFGWSHQSASPRFTDLLNEGRIVDSTHRRQVAGSGNPAIAWKLTDEARAELRLLSED